MNDAHFKEPDHSAAAAPTAELPLAVRRRFNGQLDGQDIAAWAEFDLDESNHYQPQHAVLTDQNLLIVSAVQVQSIVIAKIESAQIVEGLGVDRLQIKVAGRLTAELRYTRRCRRDIQRLHRKLARRLREPGGELPPEWLEIADRRAVDERPCPRCRLPIPAWAEGVCPRCLQQRKILWRLFGVARPYHRQVWIAFLLTLVVSGLFILPPIFLGRMVDEAINPTGLGGLVRSMPQSERVRNLVLWASLFVGTILLMQTAAWMRLRTLATIGSCVARDLRHNVYAHLQELSLRFFGKRRTGSLITRVTTDTDRLWDFIVFGSVNLVRDVLLIVVMAVVMFIFNWRLALVALAPVPILAVITYYRSMKMQSMFGRLWTYWSRLTAVVGDALPGVRVVKAFANERREVDRFDRRSDEYTAREQEVNVVWASLQPIIGGTMQLGRLLIWAVGGYLLIRHPSERNTFGTLVMFTWFANAFYEPIMELASSNRMVTRAASSAQRVFEVLDTPPDIYDKAGAITKLRLNGRVEFRSVSFSYEGAQPALREVSLVVEPGEMIGLCGPSGAGKSTFVNLLCRFFDVTDGQILVDGLDIRDYDVKWLRRQIGMVLQEPYLFHGTIADNIRYGHPEASEGQVIAAARAANAHDFIVNFPDGYDTMVGERGQSLSGGERQRISIARAILHNPRILILDEATSSVDSETEKQIQEALDRLVEGRTTLAIAHRLSTLSAADRLVVLEKGRIVEQGLQADLLDKEDGVYAKLHRMQLEMNSIADAGGSGGREGADLAEPAEAAPADR
jgi:ATP-binding cassette, subfamily B, bacterial